MATTTIPSFGCHRSIKPYTTLRNGGRRITPSYLGMEVSAGSQRFRGLRAVQAQGGGGGDQTNMKNNGGGGSGDGGGKGGGDPFETIKWICGSVGLVAFPLWRRIKNAGDTLEKVDETVEKIESVADKIGNALRDAAKDLPDGQTKLMVLKFLRVAENIEEGADTLDNVLDKITDSLDRMAGSNEEDKEKEKKEERATSEAKK